VTAFSSFFFFPRVPPKPFVELSAALQVRSTTLSEGRREKSPSSPPCTSGRLDFRCEDCDLRDTSFSPLPHSFVFLFGPKRMRRFPNFHGAEQAHGFPRTVISQLLPPSFATSSRILLRVVRKNAAGKSSVISFFL